MVAMIDKLTNQHWDVIIVGTGMGGATLGHALAKAGKRVLFCEKGKYQGTASAFRGHYPEEQFDPPSVPQTIHRTLLAEAGRNWETIEDRSLPKLKSYVPFIGAGTGGSSALYGMALERFFPEDFRPRANHPTATDSTLPEAWPITYLELAPFYGEAENLYRVRGDADPLRDKHFSPMYQEPPPLTNGGNELFDFLKEQGHHPYRLPLACEFKEGCSCCQGYLCPLQCKNDSNRICLIPALEEFGAQLLDECQVVKLEATTTKVTGVICRRGDKTITLRGDIVVLAAGALYTPEILLNSASPLWPQGIANHSGMVGKNLMRHYVDLYLLKSKIRGGLDSKFKEIAFNDFYFTGNGKLGSVQSFGALPPPTLLAESIGHDLRQDALPFVGIFYRFIQPIVRKYLALMISRRLILASVIEDLPYADNRVEVDKTTGQLRLFYSIRPSEMKRIEQMRVEMHSLFKPYSPILIRQAENNERIAHVCGTCRFGIDPTNSVLDVNNRAHGVDNLYVVDASFFPSSGGINPALTVAANALRVADLIVMKTRPAPVAATHNSFIDSGLRPANLPNIG